MMFHNTRSPEPRDTRKTLRLQWGAEACKTDDASRQIETENNHRRRIHRRRSHGRRRRPGLHGHHRPAAESNRCEELHTQQHRHQVGYHARNLQRLGPIKRCKRRSGGDVSAHTWFLTRGAAPPGPVTATALVRPSSPDSTLNSTSSPSRRLR